MTSSALCRNTRTSDLSDAAASSYNTNNSTPGQSPLVLSSTFGSDFAGEASYWYNSGSLLSAASTQHYDRWSSGVSGPLISPASPAPASHDSPWQVGPSTSRQRLQSAAIPASHAPPDHAALGTARRTCPTALPSETAANNRNSLLTPEALAAYCRRAFASAGGYSSRRTPLARRGASHGAAAAAYDVPLSSAPNHSALLRTSRGAFKRIRSRHAPGHTVWPVPMPPRPAPGVAQPPACGMSLRRSMTLGETFSRATLCSVDEEVCCTQQAEDGFVLQTVVYPDVGPPWDHVEAAAAVAEAVRAEGYPYLRHSIRGGLVAGAPAVTRLAHTAGQGAATAAAAAGVSACGQESPLAHPGAAWHSMGAAAAWYHSQPLPQLRADCAPGGGAVRGRGGYGHGGRPELGSEDVFVCEGTSDAEASEGDGAASSRPLLCAPLSDVSAAQRAAPASTHAAAQAAVGPAAATRGAPRATYGMPAGAAAATALHQLAVSREHLGSGADGMQGSSAARTAGAYHSVSYGACEESSGIVSGPLNAVTSCGSLVHLAGSSSGASAGVVPAGQPHSVSSQSLLSAGAGITSRGMAHHSTRSLHYQHQLQQLQPQHVNGSIHCHTRSGLSFRSQQLVKLHPRLPSPASSLSPAPPSLDFTLLRKLAKEKSDRLKRAVSELARTAEAAKVAAGTATGAASTGITRGIRAGSSRHHQPQCGASSAQQDESSVSGGQGGGVSQASSKISVLQDLPKYVAGTRPRVSAQGDAQVAGAGVEHEEVLSTVADTCPTGMLPHAHCDPMLRLDSGAEQQHKQQGRTGEDRQQHEQHHPQQAGTPRLPATGLASPPAGPRPDTPCPGSNPAVSSSRRSRAADPVLLAVSCTLRASDLPVREGSRGARVLTAEELRRELLTEGGSLATRALLAKHAGAGQGASQGSRIFGGKGRVAAARGAAAGVKERRPFPPIREDEGSDGGNGATGEATSGRSGRIGACGLCAIM